MCSALFKSPSPLFQSLVLPQQSTLKVPWHHNNGALPPVWLPCQWWPLCQIQKMVPVPFSRSHPKSLVCMPCQHTNIPVNVPINQACQVSPWALHIPAILSCPLFWKPSKPEVMAPMPFDRVLMPTGSQASSNWVWALHSFWSPHFICPL